MASLLDPITEERRGSRVRLASLIGAKRASGTKSEAQNDGPADPTKRRKHLWSRDHSALAVMGGFAIDAGPGADEAPFPGSRTRLVLTPHGLEFLARHHPELIPDISTAAVKDRSKADGLTKALACVQALYFLCQTIARLAVGLPVTVLELNTAAHAICALTTYVLWWYKPFDVKEPLLISARTPLAASLCAAMCMRSGVGYWIKENPDDEMTETGAHRWRALLEFDFDLQTPDESERSSTAEPTSTADGENQQLPLAPHSSEDPPPAPLPRQTDESSQRIDPEAAVEAHAPGSASQPEWTDGSFVLTPWQPQHGLMVRFFTSALFTRNNFFTLFGIFPPEEHVPEDPSVTITASVFRCCNLARKVIRDYPELAAPLARSVWGEPFRASFEGDRLDFLCDKIDDFPRVAITGTRFWGFILSAGGAVLASLLYSGVHLLAWNGPFRTAVETILWRISAAALAAPFVSLVPWTLLIWSALVVPSLIDPTFGPAPGREFSIASVLRGDLFWSSSEHSGADDPFDRFCKRPDSAGGWFNLAASILLVLLWGIACVLLLVVLTALSFATIYSYLVGRWYVVVESLLALPYSPAGVYETPNWDNYFPHFH